MAADDRGEHKVKDFLCLDQFFAGLVFLTNNLSLKPELIADLYRQRWQVELFFKWIKQHLRINVFFVTSENAVKTQIRISSQISSLSSEERWDTTDFPQISQVEHRLLVLGLVGAKWIQGAGRSSLKRLSATRSEDRQHG